MDGKTPIFFTIMHIALVSGVAKGKGEEIKLRRDAIPIQKHENTSLAFGERLTSKGFHHSVAPDVRLVAYARFSRFYRTQNSPIAGKMQKCGRIDNLPTKGCYTLWKERERR